MPDETKAPVHVPGLCKSCQCAVVHVMGQGPADPWMACVVTATILQFQNVLSHEGATVWPEGGPQTPHAVVVAFPGCWGCRFPRTWDRTLRVLLKGLSHAAKVARGEVGDPDGPFPEDVRQTPRKADNEPPEHATS